MKLQAKLPESIKARVECFFILILQKAVVLPSFDVVEDVGVAADVVAITGHIAAD